MASDSIKQLTCMPVILFHSNQPHVLTAHVSQLKLGLSSLYLLNPWTDLLSALDSNQIDSDPLLLAMEPLFLQVGPQHKETISFLVLPSAIYPVVLGLPWLKLHSPPLDWHTSKVLCWGPDCHQARLHHASPPAQLPYAVFNSGSPVPVNPLLGLPPSYAHFADIFSKKHAEALHPYHPWDCPAYLQPGKTPPQGHIYPLSVPETQATFTYMWYTASSGNLCLPPVQVSSLLRKSLENYVHVSTTRASMKITIKNHYPLSLISDLFDCVRGAIGYTKLVLRAAYILIRIREGHKWKTAFNTRDGHYGYLVMPFWLCNAPAVFQS